MIPRKSPKQIKTMRVGGQKLAAVMRLVLAKAKPGVSLKKLDQLAEAELIKKGGQPSFKMVKNYHWATCLNVNQGVVHGIPSDYCLQKGDLLSVDMGLFFQGWHTDMARTIEIASQQATAFLAAGKQAFKKAFLAARPGKSVADISQAIEKELKKNGLCPVKNLTGHGVGRELHEPPLIPCFYKKGKLTSPCLRPGMVLAIEVIYTQGKPDLMVQKDGWTITTADQSLAGLYENTIAITSKKPLILTD